MLRALFSTRYLQQLLREGKSSNEQIYFFSVLLYFFSFPPLILIFFHFYVPQLFETYSSLQIYGIGWCGVTVLFLLSRLFLWYFTTTFGYQEQRYLYTIIKTLYRFYHAISLVCLIPVIWYARIPELFFFIYLPDFLIIFSAFAIRFFRNLNRVNRIYFFIYFCTFEIMPYLLLIKLLIINI